MSAPVTSPEIGKQVRLDDVLVNTHDVGEGEAVLLIHGSGPGVSSWANWRLLIPDLSEDHRVVAPDMIGFGYTEAPTVAFDLDAWLNQLTGLLDALDIEKAHVVGNSFGGAMALRLALTAPERVGKLILMGPAAISFGMTPGLDEVWGFKPSPEAMAHLVRDVFTSATTDISDEIVALRHQASIRPGVQERYAALFPAPRQQWLDRLAVSPEEAAQVQHDTLVVHGADDLVIPLEASQRLVEAMPNARLEIAAHCGHWVQLEYADVFASLVRGHLSQEKA